MEEHIELNEKCSLINEESKTTKLKAPDTRVIRQIKGYVYSFLSCMSNAAAVMCLQAFGHLISLLLLQTVITLLYFIGATAYVITAKESLRITSRMDLFATVAMALGFGMYRYLYFMSAFFLSPTTTEGMFITAWMVIALFITLYHGQCQWHLIVSAIVCVVGILFLSQPEEIFLAPSVKFTVKEIPCNSFIAEDIHQSGDLSLTDIIFNSSHSRGNMSRSVGQLYSVANNETIALGSNGTDSYSIVGNNTLDQSSIGGEHKSALSSAKQKAIGYLLIIGASLFITMYGAGVQYLKRTHKDGFIAFWSSALALVGSLIINGIFWVTPTYFLHASWPCYILLAGHCFFGVCLIIFTMSSLEYISQAELALVSSAALVFLYICQLTFMSKIHPGRGNLMEVFGAIGIIVGNVFSPFWILFCDPLEG